MCHLPQTFRKRWVREYPNALQILKTWRKICHNLKVGHLVMVMSKNIGSVNWPMGTATGVVTQDDDLVRNITVKKSKSLLEGMYVNYGC